MGVLIVTGASRGIGAATAIVAARAGWAVLVNHRASAAGAEAVVDEITGAGGRAIVHQADIGVEDAVAAMFDAAEARLGPVTGLANNAGTLARATPFAEIDLKRWHDMLATNLTGSFLCAREAVRRMAFSRGGKGGAIVNTSSMAAVLGAPGEFVDYAAAKGGVDAMTLGLAREVAGDGIRVNGVRPGLIDTEIQAVSGDPDRARRLAGGVPMGRVGEAEEVARAIVWLLSEDAGYVTGTVLNVSGGR